ncbi:MAG TPA: PEGA domain-containing protein [Ignavibacteriaceae bacterium]|nr:PEGA domain-containing protein [Candidatus Woesebacteria bacterium]HRQ55415.1 PEGA domain-containing protein [Ignavibacteriaceae bacterium]
MKKFYKIGLFFSFIAVASLIFSSCATIFKGSTDDVNFSSDPSGAKVYVNGMLLGTTPVQLELKSKNSYTIEFKKEGYETKTVVLNNSVGAGWIVLDVLFGLVPIIVDAATGNWYSLDQEHVNGVLEEQK